MLTKKQIQRFQKLQQKKYRLLDQSFVVEGEKNIEALLSTDYPLVALYSTVTTPKWGAELITRAQMEQLTFLKSPSPYFAVFQMPEVKNLPTEGLVVALDSISDPGNLGTIIRLCDWFGVSQLVCSVDTVDCYNPKVVQASMGSIARVSCIYTSLDDYLASAQLPIFGALLEGTSLSDVPLQQNAILLMGSESHGISANLLDCLDHQITIPKYDASSAIDSLNVASATAIILAHFRAL